MPYTIRTWAWSGVARGALETCAPLARRQLIFQLPSRLNCQVPWATDSFRMVVLRIGSDHTVWVFGRRRGARLFRVSTNMENRTLIMFRVSVHVI